MKTILSSGKGFVPSYTILLVLMALYSFASAHHPPNILHEHVKHELKPPFELKEPAYEIMISELTPRLDEGHPEEGGISFISNPSKEYIPVTLSLTKGRHPEPDEGLSCCVRRGGSKGTPHINSLINDPITGTIYDAGGGIPGVVVKIKGTNIFTITDEFGQFQIDAKKGDILIFSYPDYETVEVKIIEQTEINLELFPAVTQLEEAVINAGYYTVKDKERTGSISRVTSKEIENQPVGNVLSAIQGRMAGVQIIQETSTPGGGYEIKIRGQNSLRLDGNSPLYIIDGVPYSSETIGSLMTSYTLLPNSISPLSNINVESIESIEILKDADATAIYGSRGANGVVLITTKKGKSGKTKFSFNTSSGIGKITKFIDLLNTEQYLRLRAIAFQNDGITEYPVNEYDINGTWNQNRYTDWQKKLIGGTAQFNNFNATISGGSKKTNFLLGAMHSIQTTVLPGDFKYKKSGVNLNLNHTSEDEKFSMNLTSNYVVQNNYQPSEDISNLAITLPPNAPSLFTENGNLNWENNTWSNPLARLNGVYRSNLKNLIANSMVSYNLLPYLEIKANLGYTSTINHDSRIAPKTLYNPSFGIGSESSSLFFFQANRTSWIAEPQLNYQTKIGKGKLEALIGTTFQEQKSKYLNEYGLGFTSDNLIYNLASATHKFVMSSNEVTYKYHAIFGRLNYNWENRYFINLTGRRDGSSRFGAGKKFANFGAIGAAWIFSKENFLKGSDLISFGKLRGSYGTSGNDQIGDYQFYDTYSSGSIYDGIVGLVPLRLYNPDFQWETNVKMETGVELGLFKDRLQFTAAYFKNKSSNQLVGIPLPATTGFTSIQSNLNATIQNSGLEFSLISRNLNSRDLSWTTNLNISFLRSKLIEFPGLEFSTYKNLYKIGESVNIRKVYNLIGINPETGIYQFEDTNGDGKISFPDDAQTIIDLDPKYFGGLQNEIRYKRLTLNAFLEFSKRKSPIKSIGYGGLRMNQHVDAQNFWQYPNQNAQYQILTTGLNQEASIADSQFRNSDAAIVDGSFIRLKTLSLNYSIPINKENFECMIYLQGHNLFTLTSYKYGDPEFTQIGYMPPLKIISAGIQLTL